MNRFPQISEAEYEVMKIVWKYAPINTNEITEKLLQTTSWSPKTIQTLIKRLVTKGALTYEKQSRVFVYTPTIKESDYISRKSSSFLARFYGGNLWNMFHFHPCNLHLSPVRVIHHNFQAPDTRFYFRMCFKPAYLLICFCVRQCVSEKRFLSDVTGVMICLTLRAYLKILSGRCTQRV